MALDTAILEEILGTRIKDELDLALDPGTGKADEYRQKFSEALAKAISEEVLDHILANLEIKGVTVVIPEAAVVTTPGGPTVVGVPNPAPITLIQSNDGTGRVE